MCTYLSISQYLFKYGTAVRSLRSTVVCLIWLIAFKILSEVSCIVHWLDLYLNTKIHKMHLFFKHWRSKKEFQETNDLHNVVQWHLVFPQFVRSVDPYLYNSLHKKYYFYINSVVSWNILVTHDSLSNTDIAFK
jgi:hypothetical protein